MINLHQDERYVLMHERLSKLSKQQLQAIVDNINIILFDEHNYHEGKFCPMGVALGYHLTTHPTDEGCKTAIGEHFQPTNMLKGVKGDFYHGTDGERRRDLLLLCKQILNND